MHRRLVPLAALCAVLIAICTPAARGQDGPNIDPAGQVNLRWIPSHGAVAQLDYSITHDVLAVRNSATQVRIIDAATGQLISTQTARHRFVDLDVTPDGHYFFASDDGGVNIGYGTPIEPHYVHRYDIRNATWVVLEAPAIATRLEAVSANRVLLQEVDQHVDATINSFDAQAGTMTELDRERTSYSGDIVYAPETGLVYHGNSGSSSSEVHVLRLLDDELSRVVDTGIYGSAQEGGGSLALSADGQRLFYGPLQLEAADVTSTQRTHVAPIVAATAGFAFTADGVGYSVATGEERLNLGWEPTAISATYGGDDLWLASSTGSILRCEAAYGTWGCPTALPLEDTYCDTVIPTIDMNTNGGNGNGTSGDDTILGTPGDDVISAGGGHDLVCGMGGDDIILGGSGDDVLLGGDGADRIRGRSGDDALNGGAGDDVLHADKGDDLVIGGDGNDKMYGYAGNDLLLGGDGDDRMHGNFGDDFMYGEAGDDRMFGYGDSDVISGGDDNDLLGGNFGDDRLTGDSGDDVLYGSDGSDEVDGGDGNDDLSGNSGPDVLLGGPGDDMLDGGIDFDSCTGGPGTDTAKRCETLITIP